MITRQVIESAMGNKLGLEVRNETDDKICVWLTHDEIMIGNMFIDPHGHSSWNLYLPKQEISVSATPYIPMIPKLDLCGAMWAGEMKIIGKILLPEMIRDMLPNCRRLHHVSQSCRHVVIRGPATELRAHFG